MKKLILWPLLLGSAVLAAACAPGKVETSPAAPPPTPTETVESRTAVPVAPPPDGRNLQPQLGNANIDLDDVVALLPPDAIPAIWPEEVADIMVPAQTADENGMEPVMRVLGVNINGESRAYPIPFMSAHEIVNDEVGGRLIAATW